MSPVNMVRWDFWYFNSILLLTRPSPKHPSLNVSNMLSCYSASISIIQISFVQLNLKNRPISFTWSDIHHQMMAGITLLFTVWNSTEARTQAKKDLISFKGYLAQWNNVIEKTLKTWSRIDRAQQVLQRLAQSTVEVLEDEVSGVQSDAHARRSYSKVAKRASASHLSFTNTSNSHATPTNPISRTQNDHQRRDSTRSAPNSLAMIQFNENRVIDLPASMSSVQPSFSSYSPGQRATRNDEPPIYNETSNGVSPEDMNSLDSPDKHPFNPSVPSDYIVDQPWDFSAIFGTNPLGGWDSSNMELPFSAALDGSDASMDFSDLFGNAPGLDNGDSFVHAPIPGFQNSVTNSHYYTFNTASALNFQEP
jgi:hypothetical protein